MMIYNHLMKCLSLFQDLLFLLLGPFFLHRHFLGFFALRNVVEQRGGADDDLVDFFVEFDILLALFGLEPKTRNVVLFQRIHRFNDI